MNLFNLTGYVIVIFLGKITLAKMFKFNIQKKMNPSLENKSIFDFSVKNYNDDIVQLDKFKHNNPVLIVNVASY